MDAMLTIAPRDFDEMRAGGMHIRMAPVRLMSRTCANTSGWNSSSRLITPAALTRMSSSFTRAIRVAMLVGSVTSNSGRPTADYLRAGSENAVAMAFPMPLLPPVTITCLLLKSNVDCSQDVDGPSGEDGYGGQRNHTLDHHQHFGPPAKGCDVGR